MCATAGDRPRPRPVAHLDRFVAEREGKKTVAKDLAFLRRALGLAKAHDLIRAHVFEKVAGDPVTRRRLMPPWKPSDSNGKKIPAEVFEAILAKLHSDARRAVLFARSTGLRMNEVASLDWSMYAPGKGFRTATQKGSGDRFVGLDCLDVLGPRGIGPVFAELGSNRRDRLESLWRSAVKAAKRAAKKEGKVFPHHKFHDLRHTFATEELEATGGHDFGAVAAVLGISERMAHVYAHEDRERAQINAAKRRLAEKIAKTGA